MDLLSMSRIKVSCFDISLLTSIHVSSQVIRAALKERLNQASAEDNHACLLDACVEATSRYD